MAKVSYNNEVIAQSDKTLVIEGDYYFPKESVNIDLLSLSNFHTTCPWRGHANYYHLNIKGERIENAAWYYPVPKEGSIETVGADFSKYIAFNSSMVEVEPTE